MDEVDIEDLTIEQYFSLTQENQTPKKIKDMTIAEYVEYEKKINKNHISNTKTYLPTYFSKSAPTHDPIWDFSHYFVPNQPGAESNCDSEDMEEEIEYMTDDEVVMSEQEESNHGNTQNIQHFKEKDDVDKWLNAEITKHMSMQGVENTEDALISIIKSIKKEMKGDIMKNQIEASTANIGNETYSITSNEVDTDDNNTSPIASCLLPKELSPGSFLLPFNIDDHSLYAITTLKAKDNIMPLDVYKYLGLDKLRDAGTIENTAGTNEPLGAIDILVKFGTLEFMCNFVIKMADDVVILGRSFLESTHAQIDVFNEEISFEIGSEKFMFDINSHQYIKKIYMLDMEHEEETFNPLEIGIDLFSYESPACLEAEQNSRSISTLSPQEEITKPINFSPDKRGLVKRWHVCKPITYDNGSGDCMMWPTCDPNSKFCFGYNEVFGENKQGTLRQWICFHDHERQTVKGSQMGFADFLQEIIFNEWILDSYDVKEEYAKVIGDPYSRSFDEYKRVFNNEIEHLSNEYILRIGKKGYILDDVWEKYQQNYKETNEEWHEKGYEDDELWQSGDEKTNYDPPYVNVKSFKVKIYSFNEGCSFICITDCEDEALPLGRVNGARFKAMIRNELEGNKYVHEET
ncbi:phospholipase-like protein [Tanacetum coccineum]